MSEVTTIGAELNCGCGGLSVDSIGNIYVADFGMILGDQETMGRKVFKVSPEFEVSVFAIGFEGASGNELDSKGNLFQSNIRGERISKITPEGDHGVFVTEGIEGPVGIAIDKKDTLFVANCGGNSIQKVTSAGKSTRFAESELFKCPNGVTLDDAENVYISNFYNGNVCKITPDGTVTILATIPGENNGHITFHKNYLYVVARSAHQIYKVSLDGEATLFAGSGEKGHKDGSALKAQFCYPNDIVTSSCGKFFYINEVVNTSSDGKILGPTLLRRIRITE